MSEFAAREPAALLADHGDAIEVACTELQSRMASYRSVLDRVGRSVREPAGLREHLTA